MLICYLIQIDMDSEFYPYLRILHEIMLLKRKIKAIISSK